MGIKVLEVCRSKGGRVDRGVRDNLGCRGSLVSTGSVNAGCG